MPAHDRVRLNHARQAEQVWPEPCHPDHECSVSSAQPETPRSLPHRDIELMAQSRLAESPTLTRTLFEEMASANAPPNTATELKAKIELLHAEIARLEALRALHQREFQATSTVVVAGAGRLIALPSAGLSRYSVGGDLKRLANSGNSS
jgi:hypothetical protein